MIVYNVTIKVEHEIAKEWIEWLEGGHAQAVVNTGMFSEYHFFELLEPADQEGRTFVVQYFTDSEEKYQLYLDEFAPALRAEGEEKFKDKFIGFRSKLLKLS